MTPRQMKERAKAWHELQRAEKKLHAAFTRWSRARTKNKRLEAIDLKDFSKT